MFKKSSPAVYCVLKLVLLFTGKMKGWNINTETINSVHSQLNDTFKEEIMLKQNSTP